jgi:hypothetical protein
MSRSTGPLDSIAVTLAHHLGWNADDAEAGPHEGCLMLPAHPSDHDAGDNVFSMKSAFDIVNDHSIVGKIIPQTACTAEIDDVNITITCSKTGKRLQVDKEMWPIAYIGMFLSQKGVEGMKQFFNFY